MRYIMENYDPVKKQMMGLPPTPAQPITSGSTSTQAVYLFALVMHSRRATRGFQSSRFSLSRLAYSFCVRDGFLLWLQRNSFIIVLFTLVTSGSCRRHFQRR